MYCTNCGKEINDKAVICVNCGVAVVKEEKRDSINKGILIATMLIIGSAGAIILLYVLLFVIGITIHY